MILIRVRPIKMRLIQLIGRVSLEWRRRGEGPS